MSEISTESAKKFNIDTVENAAATPGVELPWAELDGQDARITQFVVPR